MKNLSAAAIRWRELTAGLDKVNRSILARKYLNPEQRQALKDVDSQLGLELHLELPPSKLKRKFQGKQATVNSPDLPDAGSSDDELPQMKRVSDVIREKGINITEYIPRPNVCDLKPEE